MQIRNEIIVIGSEHYNALGVIRSLGIIGIKPTFIFLDGKEYYPCAKSKYIGNLIILSEQNETKIIDFLINYDSDKTYKPIIIPTGDPIVKILDNNFNKLKDKYYVPNISNTQGMISKYMDKSYQMNLCDKYSVLHAKSFEIDLTKKRLEKISIGKCIVKPLVSADGKKDDISICNNDYELYETLKKFQKENYKKVIVQEFIDYDTEYAMMGIAFHDKIIIPGINDNINIYPKGRGNTSYSRMFPLENFELDVSPIINMISSIDYTGLFEIECFKKGKSLYFNEINLRNSANLFAYYGNGINYIYIYILLILNKDRELENEKLYVDKSYYFVVDHLHIKQLKEGTVSLFQLLKHLKNSTKVIYFKYDKAPFFQKYKNAFKKRILRRKI